MFLIQLAANQGMPCMALISKGMKQKECQSPPAAARAVRARTPGSVNRGLPPPPPFAAGQASAFRGRVKLGSGQGVCVGVRVGRWRGRRQAPWLGRRCDMDRRRHSPARMNQVTARRRRTKPGSPAHDRTAPCPGSGPGSRPARITSSA